MHAILTFLSFSQALVKVALHSSHDLGGFSHFGLHSALHVSLNGLRHLPFIFRHPSHVVGSAVEHVGFAFFGFLALFGAFGRFGFFGAAVNFDGGPTNLHLFNIELKPNFSQNAKFASSKHAAPTFSQSEHFGSVGKMLQAFEWL